MGKHFGAIRTLGACATSAILFLSGSGAFASQKITRVDAPGAAQTFAYGLNNAGDVAGYYIDTSGGYHGYIRDSDGTYTPFDAPGAVATIADSINADGTVTGYFYDSSLV